MPINHNNVFSKFIKKYIFKHRGTTRLVWLFPRLGVVVKIPNFTYSMSQMLMGMYCNYYERSLTKQFKDCFDDEYLAVYSKIAPTYFACWFGLFSIQKYVWVLSTDDISEFDREYFKNITTDFNYRNFGYTFAKETQEPLKLVCIDYAN